MIHFIYVCSADKDPLILKWFEKHNFKDYILVTDKFKSLYHKKRTIVSALPLNAWALILEGNITEVVETKDGVEKDKPISPQQLLKVVNGDVKRAEAINTPLIGYATNSNLFFRSKHYRDVGFVWGKMCAYRNVLLNWDLNVDEMQDYAHCSAVLEQYGRVLVNNFLYSKSKSGGRKESADYARRVPGKIKAVKYFMKRYKGLYRIKDRKGYAPNSEIVMRISSSLSIAKWRMSLNLKGYTRT